MATVTHLGSAQNNGSTTIGVSPSQIILVGSFIVVCLGDRDNAISAAPVDNSSQAGAANSYALDASRTDQGDAFSWIYSCRVTREIETTDTITATFVAGGGDKFMTVLLLSPIETVSPLDQVKTSFSSGDAPTWTTSATAATAQADEIAVGLALSVASVVEPTNPVPDSPWVEMNQSFPSGAGWDVSYRILSATGTYSYTGAWGVTMDGTGTNIIATYKITAPPAASSFLPAGRRGR